MKMAIFTWVSGLFKKSEPRHYLFLSYGAMIEFLKRNPLFDHGKGLYFFGNLRGVILRPLDYPSMYQKPTEWLDPEGTRISEDFLRNELPQAEREGRVLWPRQDYANCWQPYPELIKFLEQHGYRPCFNGLYYSFPMQYVGCLEEPGVLAKWVEEKKLPLIVVHDD